MIISLSYLIVSLHQKSLQNHKKSTNFGIFRIQKRIHAGYVNEQHPGTVTSYRYAVFTCLITFKTQKWWFLMIFLVFSCFCHFSPKTDDFFRFTTLKYAPRLLFSWFYATMMFSYCTNLPIISADRIERPKNRTECDFGVLSDPHLLWDGVVTFWSKI